MTGKRDRTIKRKDTLKHYLGKEDMDMDVCEKDIYTETTNAQ